MPDAGGTKLRRLSGPARRVERILLTGAAVLGAAWALELHHLLPVAFFSEQFFGLFLGVSLAGLFVSVRGHGREPRDAVPFRDWLLAAAALTVGGYVTVLYPRIAYELGVASADKVLLGGAAILLVLEATRRTVGWTMVALAAGAILYTRVAASMPGALQAPGATWPRIALYLYLDTNALLGLPLAVTASVVGAFLLFGRALHAAGADRIFTDLAMAVAGRFRGGPAKAAVVGSSLFGTVSGNAVSNVALDGPITIPLMVRAGYAPHVAAAIEAVASTGGQIVPPVMGVAAFLIAEFLAIPYGEVALAAAIPAVLYYIALFVQVDLEAARHGLVGTAAAAVPRLGPVLQRGWPYLVPLAILVYTLMVASWEAGKAGMAAVLATFGLALARGHPETGARATPRAILQAFEDTGRMLVEIVAMTAVAGLVIGALHLSGLAFTLSLVLVSAAGGSAILLLLLTAVVCTVLGMGMPTAIVYIMLAVLVGPALVEVGVNPLAAHLFVFYFGMLSMITPPVCLATYTAASIAGSDFLKTGLSGMRLGVVAYVVPFVFALHPALLLNGSAADVVVAVLTAVAGVILLAVGCAGYLFGPLTPMRRAMAVTAGLLLVPPPSQGPLLVANLAGVALGAGLVAVEWSARARGVPRAPSTVRQA